MPWRGAEVPGEFPTLGYLVADWIEEMCAIPDGEFAGDPYLLTDEQLNFLLHFYRLDEKDGSFYYRRGGQLIRPQKWGKGPFSSAVVWAEAEGPVVFDGWDADGEPVGRPWATPWIQITAVSEAQTANVWRALLPMAKLGKLSPDVPDVGETRINLPGGGRIEPVTASARSRLGQRITFALEDETHAWLERNGGRDLADNQRRNLAGMKGRFMETTNAFDPAEESVAQLTYETQGEDVFIDDVDPGEGSVRNKRERRRMLKTVYGDSATGDKERGIQGWIDLDRIDAEIQDLLTRDAPQAERFFLNRKRAGESRAFVPEKWDETSRDHQPPAQALITLGIDGARFHDALAIVATEVETGYQWPVGIWEEPKDAPEDYEHDLEAVDQAVIELLQGFKLWRAYVDPQYIETLLERWQGRYGEKVFVPWYTSRPRQVGWAVREFTDALQAGDLSHDPDKQLAAHVKNAVKMKLNVRDPDTQRFMHSISKDRPDSPRKIDGAMAAVLSWEARGDAIASGATAEQDKSWVTF